MSNRPLAIRLTILGAIAIASFFLGNLVFGLLAQGTWVLSDTSLGAPDLRTGVVASYFLFVCRLAIFYAIWIVVADRMR
jgi:hypothetical protein